MADVQNESAKSEFSARLMQIIVGATNTFGVRSSKRTNEIHTYIKNYIEQQNPLIRCVIEYNLRTELCCFCVDIVMFNRETDELIACLLFKSINSSLAKNRNNYHRSKLGEALDARSGMDYRAKLLFLDVVPVKCPTYGSGECIKRWEIHSPENIKNWSKRVMNVANKGRISPSIDDIYTISVEYDYIDRKTQEFKRIIEESDLERFDVLIKSLVRSSN